MPTEKASSLTRRLIFGLLFGFIVMIALTLIADLRQVSERVLTFKWSLYPWVMLLTLFNYLLRGYKFHFYLRQVGASEIPIKESYHLFVAGFPLAVTPGKVGEVLKGVWIHHRTGVSTAKGLAVVVAERISDGLAVLLLSTLGVIAYPQYWPGFVFVLIVLLGVIVISQIRPMALALLEFSKKLPIIKRFSSALIEFYEGSFALFKPTATIMATGLGMVSWLGEGIGFYLILRGLGLPPSGETLSIAVFVLAFSTVIGAVSALPGGLGAAEASIAGMLALILGLSTDTAAAATLLIRFATLWFSVLLGLIAWAFSRELLGLKPQIDTGGPEAKTDEF